MYAVKDGETRRVGHIQDMAQSKGGNPERFRLLWCPFDDYSNDSRQLDRGCGGCGAEFVEYIPGEEPEPEPEMESESEVIPEPEQEPVAPARRRSKR